LIPGREAIWSSMLVCRCSSLPQILSLEAVLLKVGRSVRPEVSPKLPDLRGGDLS
jgi:hypothetical protein